VVNVFISGGSGCVVVVDLYVKAPLHRGSEMRKKKKKKLKKIKKIHF